MTPRPIVLLHGYSDRGESFGRWRELLERDGGYATETIHVSDYVTLSDEITIKDVAEGLERALQTRPALAGEQEFDAIVHSTGGLVIRQWLANYAPRGRRLGRLIGLAPAMFGSPLAHKGRSWIGGVIKGNRHFGPDFLEAGDRILSGLELGSRFTWELAERDLLGEQPTYGEDGSTPYPFTIVGGDGYGGLRGLVNEEGTDGTVRWAGASLTSRKLVVDLTRQRAAGVGERYAAPERRSVDVPFALVPDQNHGSILRDPTLRVQQMVLEALAVGDLEGYRAWNARHGWRATRERDGRDLWQQLVVRALDERGDPIPDWYAELGHGGGGAAFEPLDDFALDVHAYRDDPSFRCFHVNLTKLDPARRGQLALRVVARSGTKLVDYRGAGSGGTWDACIELPPAAPDLGDGGDVTFFYPYTTTLVEVWLDREPLPFDGLSDVLRFLAAG
jgi:hypothetical protein